MDPRIREHAEVVVNHSVGAEAGDDVVIDAHPVADDFVVALHEALADVGANPLVVRQRTGKRFRRAYLRNHDGDFDLPEHETALFEAMDAYIAVRGDENVTEESDIDGDVQTAYSQARQPLLETRLGKTWCLTQYPAAANAQLAEMSTEAYENFVYDAVLKDWDAVREHQAQMKEIMDDAEEVRIRSGEDTDLRMSVAGNETLNDDGHANLPGGEVFTAPVPDSVEGEVFFDKPVYQRGKEITGARLRFEGGEAVEWDAEKNADTLDDILTTDEGARRVGELGIGMNRDIDRFTYNMLFDEKMGDTVHLAVGRAYDACVGEGNEHNDSAVHVDMIVDMSEDSVIEVDGEVVQRNGTFRFEDGFEA
ncbi:aminopeptidase [Halosegnis marinus]|uniref:Aminopeptidase n=1 Tax=Halosegnis marinus TaxID=3034023 RepID=A0ABD5ZMQ4_9EURY|nr:aminopeptidase [Halosegnis sp. DT85]